jgi:hypothetical protein
VPIPGANASQLRRDWENTLKLLRPGGGHHPVRPQREWRSAALPGEGNEIQEQTDEQTKITEKVETFRSYLPRYIAFTELCVEAGAAADFDDAFSDGGLRPDSPMTIP